MLTAQDVFEAFEEYKRDVSDVGQTLFLKWLRFTTTFLYGELKKVDPEKFTKDKPYAAITALPYTGTLPIDFQDINQTSCGIYNDATGKKLTPTSYGSKDEGYYITGSNTLIITGDATVDRDYTMRYIPKAPIINGINDYLTVDKTALTPEILEDRHLEDVVLAIDVLYEQWDANKDAESVADFRFVRALGKIFDNYHRAPRVSTMSNPSVNF